MINGINCQKLIVLAAASLMTLASAAGADHRNDSNQIRHVLLISVDGLHALDVSNYVSNHPGSALAELSRAGVTYTGAHTPANSDSFPRLLALVTGGSPISHDSSTT
jgi:predicted AlkP superfamily pyrophosphatase or phosphodiesterase